VLLLLLHNRSRPYLVVVLLQPRMLLFHCCDGGCRSDYMAKCPGWSYKLWTDKNLSSLRTLDTTFFEEEPTHNGKANILRAAILYEHGGVYVDADIQWVNDKCLDDFLLLASDTGFLAAMEPGTQFVANSVIGAVRHHPVARLYQQVQVILSTDNRTGEPWQRTGPLGLNAAMRVADNHASSRHCAQSTTKLPQQEAPQAVLGNQDTLDGSAATQPGGMQASAGGQGQIGAQTAAGSRLVLQHSYFDKAVPAATSFLVTLLNSRCVCWTGGVEQNSAMQS
jgi:hypothetical protein